MIRNQTGTRKGIPQLILAIAICILVAALPASGQQPSVRITQPIDESKLVPLAGSVHPLARAEFDRGAASNSLPLHRMLLLLGRSAEQEAALRTLLDEQQRPGSPSFRKWLTPEQFGQQFGPAQADIQTITNWLAVQGFTVNRVAKSGMFIEFDGSAGQLRQAFHTQLHQYVVKGAPYWANATIPQIPAALAPVVTGFASLYNFPRRHYAHVGGSFTRDARTGAVLPDLTGSGGSYYALGPGDFATIYNSLPLLTAGNDGNGQTIAIVGETNLNTTDVANFRSLFGLNAGSGSYQVVLDGPDPGITSTGEESEALLDSQWSGAVAPGAAIKFVLSESTEISYGIDLSALYIVDNNLAGVMSESYGECEQGLGTANLFYNFLWEEAAAQGITVVISSGDSGSAGCDDPNSEYRAIYGLAVNGIGSTPFNVAVGGTDFNDAGSFSTYWSGTNGATAAGVYSLGHTSALSYIPEMVWNESCGNNAPPLSACVGKSNGAEGGLQLWSGSGGRSNCASGSGGTCAGYSKPSWQAGVDSGHTVRVIPDLSFFAAGGGTSSNSFFVLCQSDLSGPTCVGSPFSFYSVGGTSASAPAFAGVVALAEQKTGGRLGNLNYLLYPIAAQGGAMCNPGSPTSGCIFYDTRTGTNSVPCSPGTSNCSATSGTNAGVLIDASNNPAYPAVAGYDPATGLGTPNITNLVNALYTATSSGTPTTSALTLNGATTLVSTSHGQAITVAVTVQNTGGTGAAPTGDVSIVSSTPVTGIDFDTLNTPSGSQNSVSWSSPYFPGSTGLPGGTYSVSAYYAGDSSHAPSTSNSVTVQIGAEASKTFVILETEYSNGNVQYVYTGSASIGYGTPYILRYDVVDYATGAVIANFPYVYSKCLQGTASCATGTLSVTDSVNGAPAAALDGGSFTLNPNASAEDLFVNLPGGTNVITVNYPGDPSYNASSGTITVTVGKAATSISSAPTANPPAPGVGNPVTLSATVLTNSNGLAPTGTVTFYDGSNALSGTGYTLTGFPASGTTAAYANASLNVTFGVSGSHSITASYGGDGNYAASATSPALALTVSGSSNPTPTITTPTSSSNPALGGVAVTLTTTVSPGGTGTAAPTGAVTFADGSTTLSGAVNYNTVGTTMTATLSHTFTTTGTHSITATVAADSNYNSATSSTLSLTVNGPVTPTMSSSSITVTGASSSTDTLTITPAVGFGGGSVTVTCSPNSTAATCSPVTNPVTVPACPTAPCTSVTDTINYSVPALAANHTPPQVAPWKSLGGLVLAGVFLLALPGVRRRSRWWLTGLLLLGSLATLSCGGGAGTTTPSSVTYVFTVTTTYNSVSSSTTFSVTVN